MTAVKPGDWMDNAPYVPGVDFNQFRMRVPTDRYYSSDYLEREKEQLWMRVWQIAGRAEELPEVGDWKVHTIFDQSYVIVRGTDGVLRGFVNACRHRGNRMCSGKGHSARLVCRYHNWIWRLDGSLLKVAQPDFEGSIEDFAAPNDELGLLPASVECFAGFIFLNPDPYARPLAEFLGAARDVLAQYHLEEMIPLGLNVREVLECNWKVVIDAFGEGYHVQGVHTQLVGLSDMARERFNSFGNHSASTVPFGRPGDDKLGVEKEVQALLSVPIANFPTYRDALPRFAEAVQSYRRADGSLDLPEGLTPRKLLQQIRRATWTDKGLDVSGLTDTQMTDFQYWVFFPNVFIQICAGEATIISAEPYPDGDPNRCVWHVRYLEWAPPEERATLRTDVREMPEGEHFDYNIVLQQDFDQMEIQQGGLRNKAQKHMTLTKCEPRVAHFHTILDHWVA